MVRRNRRYVTLTLVLLVTSAAFAMTPPGQKARMYLSGAVVPQGARTLTSTEHSNLWLSVEGERWVSRDTREQAAAYYALIIPPQVVLRRDGKTSTSDGVSHIDTLKWAWERDLGGGSREAGSGSLTISYHGVSREVVVGSDTYSLAGGNLFVIHLDGGWQPHVTQIRTNLNQIDGFEGARQLVKRAFPDDEAVKGL